MSAKYLYSSWPIINLNVIVVYENKMGYSMSTEPPNPFSVIGGIGLIILFIYLLGELAKWLDYT